CSGGSATRASSLRAEIAQQVRISRERLGDPPPPPQAAAVLRAPRRQERENSPSSQALTDEPLIIRAVAEYAVWMASVSPSLALVRRDRINHVIPDPHSSSCGSICHGMPLRRTKTMPVRHARSETRGRPSFGRLDGIGKNGSTRSGFGGFVTRS